MKRRLSNKRFINKLESKIKYLRAFPFSSFFFFFNHFHVANIDLSTRCNRTLYIIKLRAPRVRGGKKKEKRRKKKTAAVRILYTRARANILIVPFQPYRSALPPPSLPLRRVQKHGHVCRAGETEPEFTHRRILSKMRSRSIKSREIPRPCHKGIASIRSIPRCVPGSRRFANRSTIPRARLLAFRLFGEESQPVSVINHRRATETEMKRGLTNVGRGREGGEKEERKKERKWMGRVRAVYGDGDSHYD